MDPSLSKSIDPPSQAPPPPPPLSFLPPAITINTTTTTTAAAADQIPNHTAHVANPTPSLPQTLNHPPYSEMIYAAISGLKEKNGSSRRAIAKYIERVYTDLPATHSALLTHHLKRLKNNGHLVMVKKSYKLPTSAPRSDAPNNIALPVPVPVTVSVSVSAPPPPKKGRGRPSKPKPKPTDAGPLLLPPHGPVHQPTLVKRGPGRPPKNGPIVPTGPTAALGNKARGRPPKSGPIGPKKTTARPRKPKSLAAPNGLKRGRGRPPKALAQAQPKAIIVPYAAAGAQNVMRPRGRPKKAAVIAAAAAAAAAAPAGGVVMGKPRGRPPKVDGVVKPKKPKNTAGRPVGRPKKNVAEAAEPQQVAYADLKRKLEFLQTKVKQAVGVLKPQFTSESDISAIAAIQELEGLAAMDISTPLREEPLPQPPLLQN